MAMDIGTFTNALINMQKSLEQESDKDKAIQNYANLLSEAVVNLIKSSEIEINVLTSEIKVFGNSASQANISVLTLKGNDSVHSGGIK